MTHISRKPSWQRSAWTLTLLCSPIIKNINELGEVTPMAQRGALRFVHVLHGASMKRSSCASRIVGLICLGFDQMLSETDCLHPVLRPQWWCTAAVRGGQRVGREVARGRLQQATPDRLPGRRRPPRRSGGIRGKGRSRRRQHAAGDPLSYELVTGPHSSAPGRAELTHLIVSMAQLDDIAGVAA